MVDPEHSFHVADYVVFGLTIVVSIGIGIYYALAGDGQRTTSEYLVGGRAMKFLPVAISLMVSFESSIMMLGLPAEVYVYGIQWWLSCVGYLFSQLLSILIVVPLLHPLRITSAYEYLQLRFNSTAVRLLGSFLGILTYTWYMGIVLFGPAIALEAVTGFPQWSSIFVIAFVAVVYTSIGGLKAVIWTDVFQAFVMYAGMFAILIKGTLDVGGPTEVWDIASKGGRLDLFNFDPDPTTRHTFWNLFFGSLIRGFGLAFNQSTIQRISSTSTKREARWVLLITAPCFFLSLTMACYEGVVAYAYYQTKQCDPLAAKKITDPNQVIPFTVMDIFKTLPGMPGLFLASLFSASLSTLSSGLSSLSALVWTDFIKPRIGEVSEVKATIIAKVIVVVFGLLGCGVALLVSLIGGTLVQISGSLLAAFGGPLTGMFLMGCFCPWVNSKGAFVGGLSSLILTSWLSLGNNFSKAKKKTPWLPLAGTEQCSANHSASLFSTMTADTMADMTSYYDVTDSMVHHDNYGSIYGGYSTLAATVMESTTAAAVAQVEPQGIEVMYTMSYQLLAPFGIMTTIILGTVVSLLTGGNKKGEVHPRYLISFCDNMCCFLPEAVRKLFRCGEDYTSVKDDEPPIHDLFLDTEMTIINPNTKDPAKDIIDPNTEDPAKDALEKNNGVSSLTVVTEVTETSARSDVKPGDITRNTADVEPQNGGASEDLSATKGVDNDGDDDVGDDGDVPKDNDERKVVGEKEQKKEKEEEEEKKEEEMDGEGEKLEGEMADSPETHLVPENDNDKQ